MGVQDQGRGTQGPTLRKINEQRQAKRKEEEKNDTKSKLDSQAKGSAFSGEGLKVVREVCLPYLSAGLGMVGAGIVLDRVQYWDVFQNIPQLFILVPALIGLKGNLEMTLASRLSTQANLGGLDTISQTLELGGFNLALTQLQGIVVGFLAACIALVMSAISGDTEFNFSYMMVACSSSIITASIASFSLGLVMVAVIAVSRRLGVDPDNIATPVAAALGDLVTLALLSAVASILYAVHPLVHIPIILLYTLIALYCQRISALNKETKEILKNGWTPVLSAMVISSLGGAILNQAIEEYPNIAMFQPVINGVAGNLVGIQASRISTQLHKHAKPGVLPKDVAQINLFNPRVTFFGGKGDGVAGQLGSNSVAARMLLLLVVPGHIVFNTAIGFSKGFGIFTFVFLVLYLLVAILQVSLLLHIASILVYKLWQRGIDPDNAAIPYLTALGDLFGGALLAGVFFTLDKYNLN